jgi:hypothetical protein
MNRDDIMIYCAKHHYSAAYASYWLDHIGCETCGASSEPPHHIRTRGAGGSDNASNLLALCVKHHRQIHDIGDERFGTKHPSLINKIVRAKSAPRMSA